MLSCAAISPPCYILSPRLLLSSSLLLLFPSDLFTSCCRYQFLSVFLFWKKNFAPAPPHASDCEQTGVGFFFFLFSISILFWLWLFSAVLAKYCCWWAAIFVIFPLFSVSSRSLLLSVSLLPVPCSSSIFLFRLPFHYPATFPPSASLGGFSSLCCQLISLGGSFVSFTLFSHCTLCLFAHFTLPFSSCPCSSFFSLFASFLFCDVRLFFCRQVSLLFAVCFFVKLARLFYFIAHPLSSPHLFILLPPLLCLNIIFLFVDS